MKRWLVRGAVIVALLGVLGALVVVSGVVPIKASSGHFKVTEWFLSFAMKRSVATHSLGIEAPALQDPRLIVMGAGHYEGGCKPCHGAPGQRIPVIAQHMTPPPPELAQHMKQWDDGELFYIVRHGVKLTGMPAWPATSRDDEVWGVVAFLRKLPSLDHQGYQALVHGKPSEAKHDGAPAIVVRVCGRCHGVDGLGRAEGSFPRLAGQRPEYLRWSIDDYARGARQSGIMRPIAANMTAAEVEAMVDWYSAQQPPKRRAETAGSFGEAIAQLGIPERRIPACAGCHGPKDKPHHPAYPRLSGQYVQYLEQQLRLFTQGVRGGGRFVELMKEAVTDHALDPDQARAVAEYYASLPTDPGD
jgi:cytochrome c553